MTDEEKSAILIDMAKRGIALEEALKPISKMFMEMIESMDLTGMGRVDVKDLTRRPEITMPETIEYPKSFYW